MNKPTLFLDTTIQIDRVGGSMKRQVQLEKELANYRLITSTYVLGEYLRTIVKDAIYLYGLVDQCTYLDEVLTDLGRHPNKRESSRMMMILGGLLRSSRIITPSFQLQTRSEFQERLSRYIEFGLLKHFMLGISEIMDSTQCGLARERPQLLSLMNDNVLSYQLRSQCTRYVRECDLAERMEAWRPELAMLADGLAHESDPVLVRMGQLAQQISENPVVARGRNCTWYLGDLVIALELPADVPLYTTNVRHFAPILAILGKKLHESTPASTG